MKVVGGWQLYGVGQIFDFSAVSSESGSGSGSESSSESPIDIVSTPVSNNITTKHNNSYLDIGSLGLDLADQQELAIAAQQAQQDLLGQVGILQEQRLALGADIVTLQGQINEAKRALNGINAIATTGIDVIAVQQKISDLLLSLNKQLIIATTAYNLIPDQIMSLRNRLTNLTDLVK